MFNEDLLLAAIMQDRQAYEDAMKIGLEANDFSDGGKLLVQCADEQYKRDVELACVSIDAMRLQIARKVRAKDMVDSYMKYAMSLPSDVSNVNISEEYRLLRRRRVGMLLAAKLANGLHDSETEALLSKYAALSQQPGGRDDDFRMTPEDFDEDHSERIPLAPKRLNDFIGGGVLRGHNIVVYGRPDSGKSLFALNQAAYACAMGYKVLYVANEEPKHDVTRRLLSRLSNTPVDKVIGAEDTTMQSVHNEYQQWHLLHKAGLSIKDIRAAAGKIQPDIIVIDQLRNISSGGNDNRALQLDKLAREVREIGIEFNAVTISVTQAGDSASNKVVLQMNDIEWSNTGIPGAADLLIGIGLDDEYDMQNKRQISLPKNKINGRHGNFPVWIDTQHTAINSRR